MSCKIFDIPVDESVPSAGDTLLANPDASAPSDNGCVLLLLLFIVFSVSCFVFFNLSITTLIDWLMSDLIAYQPEME